MKRINTLVLLLCFAGSLFAQGKAEQDARNARVREGKMTEADKIHFNGSGRDSWLYSHKAITPFIPDDLAVVDKRKGGLRPYFCSNDGTATPIEPHTNSGDCGEFVSIKTGTKWRMRDRGGYIDRAFEVYKDGTVREHVIMDANVVVSMSKEAEKIAQGNGYQLDSHNNTMVASGTVVVPNSGQARVGIPNSTPQQNAQLPTIDCNKLDGFIAKTQCFARAANATGVLTKP